MNKTVLIILALILVACTPQVTVTSQVTVTLAPPTPIPTPTLHPDFVDLQQSMDLVEGLTLTNDGTIEHNGEIVPNITVTADGNYVLVVGEEMIMFAPDEVTLDPEKGIIPNGYELNENREWVEAQEPIKEFPIVSSVDYRDCKLESVDELAEYYRWFETLAQPFEEGQLDQRPWYLDSLNTIMPDTWIPRDPGTVTAHLNTTFCSLEVDGILYKIIPFELPDPSDPTNPEANIKVLGFQVENRVKNGVIGDVYPQAILDKSSLYWAEKVTVPPIVASYFFQNSSVEIPLAKRTWEALGEEKMTEIFARLQTGDTTALRELQGYPIMLSSNTSEAFEQ